MREINLDGEIPSAVRGEAIADTLADLAEREGVSYDQITAEALRLYILMPGSGRTAWRSSEGDADASLDEAAWAAGLALSNHRFNTILEAVRQRGRPPLPPNASEQDILDYAVEITRRR